MTSGVTSGVSEREEVWVFRGGGAARLRDVLVELGVVGRSTSGDWEAPLWAAELWIAQRSTDDHRDLKVIRRAVLDEGFRAACLAVLRVTGWTISSVWSEALEHFVSGYFGEPA